MLARPAPGSIPDAPGSYLFMDGDGRVIYVGKAKSLRQRLSNYFQSLESLMPRTQAMVLAAESLEWIQVASDVEALVLEYSLIKRYKPRYNVKLRDDKSYPMLCVTVSDEWPKALVTRGARIKGAKYFGPYPHASAIRETLDVLQRSFQIRTCSDSKFVRQQRLGKPCLLYHIERCKGPCIAAITEADYGATVDKVCSFLKGDTRAIVDELAGSMRTAAESLEFERAARFRDQLEAVNRAIANQQVLLEGGGDLDVVGFEADELEVSVQVLHVRQGRLLGRRGFILDRVEDLELPELLFKVIELNYAESAIDIASEVVVPMEPVDADLLSDWLGSIRTKRVKLTVAKRGNKRALLDMAEQNARDELSRHRMKRASDHNARAQALTALAEYLGLNQAPLRIECYDMSHLQGTNYVGSMVVMEDGLPKRSDYRRFRVSTPKNDDYAAMQEVLNRRLARLVEESQMPVSERSRRFSYPPNLVLVDGGKGQLSVAIAAVEALGLTGQIELASLAKEFEEVYRPGSSEPIRIPRGSQALFMLQQIRDEAHRFAITYHRTLRAKRSLSSALDGVPGLGPKRRQALLDAFGGIKKLRTASVDEIKGAGVLPESIAEMAYAALHAADKNPIDVEAATSPRT